MTAELNLAGRFIIRGSYLGYVNQPQVKTVRVAVPQSVISRVRSDSQAVMVRSSSRFDETYAASVLREVPEGSKTVAASALTTEGGGNIALDPTARDEIQALENWFQFDLQLPAGAQGRVGERVYVRFEHSKCSGFRGIIRLFNKAGACSPVTERQTG